MAEMVVFAFSPPGAQDPSIAIAACRAGAVGVLNGELGCDDSWLSIGLQKLARHVNSPFGLALMGLSREAEAEVIGYAPKGLQWLILPVGRLAEDSGAIARVRAAGVRLVAEATAWNETYRDADSAVDGWLIKGHESGGAVGEETSFVLLQRWRNVQDLPVYVRGGVGLHNAASCVVGGAAGVALDSQLLLLQESPVKETLEPLLKGFVGTETALVGDPGEGRYLRLLDRPGFAALRALRQEAHGLSFDQLMARLRDGLGWDHVAERLLPIGQDAAFAYPLAKRYKTVGSTLNALSAFVKQHLQDATERDVIGEDSALARAHGTRYPIVQGPMTRVSDSAPFAKAIADGGGLPMLALALMRPDGVRELLHETTERLQQRPWGVGLLGFAPAELLEQQITVVREFRPSFAIIAGGRPDHALAFETSGVPSYLHVPSPRLLSLFVEQGARRFVFEGRECGGHIGPLSSLVLWDSMVQALLDEVKDPAVAESIHVLFAGGIHDSTSASMVGALAAPLVARGIKVGLLMGSAYLFTKEIVSSGAVVSRFQKEALACERTVALETGTGHASRCADTPFAQEFLSLRRKLQGDGRSPDEIRDILEDLNLGRLRLASKGVARSGGAIKKVTVKRQQTDGMYMIGQVAALIDTLFPVEELHRHVTVDAQQSLSDSAHAYLDAMAAREARSARPADVAIVGIGCMLPKAQGVREYWDNILDKVDAITKIPPHRWDWRLYYDADRYAEDKIYSKWGGFLDDLAFDPLKYGIPPKAVKAVDPLQLMALEVVRQTLDDAGYGEREFDREGASVILGASGGAGDVGCQYAVRAETPRFRGDLEPEVAARLPEWTEDSFAGILLNVAAGRAANRFDFGGANFTVDSACASSLTSVYLGVSELVAGRSDLVIAGGIDTVQGPFGYLCFSKTQALSPRGRCRTFDTTADGIVISEGIAMVALKRLQDAERDGDRIYAVIKGVGASSDGKARSMTAPHPGGQIRALRRAYEMAGYSAATVGSFEAHGTGTVAGDTAELETVTRLLAESHARPRTSAIGSVKTLIGHTKASAGVAGLIKSVLALHHKVLPPHANVTQPNARLADPASPLHLVDRVVPWVADQLPRRASVSAFGFGGTNFHVALEEYRGEYLPGLRSSVRQRWPAELLVWRRPDRAALAADVAAVRDAIRAGATPKLRDLAFSLARNLPDSGLTAAVVVHEGGDLAAQLDAVAVHLADPARPLPPRAYFSEEPRARDGKVAVLFAGQGSQYLDMLRELAALFPEFGESLGLADALLAERYEAVFGQGARLSRMVYAPGLYDDDARRAAEAVLMRPDVAQPALGTVEAALWNLLRRFGLAADMTGGHSYGEYVALHAAGAFSLEDLIRVSEARGRFIVEATEGGDLGAMAAVPASREEVEAIARGYRDLTVANHNAPRQTILSGSGESIAAVIEDLAAKGIHAQRLAVGAAFHSPFMAAAKDRLGAFLKKVPFADMRVPVYSNTTASFHTGGAAALCRQLADHLVKPVEFVSEIRAMYDDGARLFVGIGPKNVSESLVDKILADSPHTTVRLDDQEGGFKGLLGALGALLSEGVPLDLELLFAGRNCRLLNLDDLVEETRAPSHPAHVWMLNGSGAHPVGTPASPPLTVEDVQQARPVRPAPSSGQTVTRSPGGQTGRHIQVSEVAHMTETSPAQAGDHLAAPTQESEATVNVDPYEREAVLNAYHETMRQFLQVQESVMLAFLTGTAAPGQGAAAFRRVHPARRVISQRPTAAAPRPRPSMPAPAPAAAPQPAPAAAPAPQAEACPQAPPSAPRSVPVTPSPTPASGGGNGLGREAIEKTLLGIVEERTGYPQDMLGLDQNMEADLGIDSIKRVEIVGAVLKTLPQPFVSSLGDASGELNSQRTLGGIIDWLASRAEGGAEGRSPFEQTGTRDIEEGRAPLPRFIIEARPQPADKAPRGPLKPGAYLVVGGDVRLEAAVSKALEAAGGSAVRISPEDCLDPERLHRAIEQARAAVHGLQGVVHLAATGMSPVALSADLAEWQRANRLAHVSLLRALQEAADDLHPGGRVVAASAFGGYFARSDAPANPSALLPGGGHTGMLKSLREEWPAVRCKAVDLDASVEPASNAAFLIDEMTLEGGRIEVGFPDGQRTVFHTVAAATAGTGAPRMVPEPGWVILAMGGARGITAEILGGFGAPGVTLVLVGRTALPDAEGADTVGARSANELRPLLLRRAKAEGRTVRPVDIERDVNRILRNREILANIRDLQATGATVEYRVADVRDDGAVSALLADIYDRHGHIDGVLHGAGVIEDQNLVDKTLDSWERVFGTKVDSTFLLARHLRPDSLRFLMLFASVAGRYGNSGQTDYAAANEVLNRMAWQLNALWDERVRIMSVNWGPWLATTHGTGMVSAETQRKFEGRGVELVPPDAGRRFCVDEVRFGMPGHVELVAGGGPWDQHEEETGAWVEPEAEATQAASYPLLSGIRREEGAGGAVVLVHDLDLGVDRFLNEHLLDGIPVMPAAGVLELFAESAAEVWPDWEVAEVSDFRVLRGIRLEIPRSSFEIVLRSSSHGDASGFEVGAQIRPRGGGPSFYRATVHMASERPPVVRFDQVLRPSQSNVTARAAYAEWLFHGPAFQVMRRIVGLDEQGAVAEIAPSDPTQWLPSVKSANGWIFDPAVVDSAPQMALVWARANRGVASLPSRFSHVRLFGDEPLGECKMLFRAHPGTEEHLVKADVAFVDGQQRLRIFMEAMECTASDALVRLGGGWKGAICV